MNSAFSKDRFENDSTSVVIHDRAKRFEIVAGNKLHIFQERLESLAIFILPGQ